MANLKILYRNLADEGVLSSDSELTSLPVSNLQTPHVAQKWRTAVGSAYLLLDLGAPRLVDTVALMGCNLTADAVMRLRLSSDDASGAAGDVYDGGAVPAAIDPHTGYLVILLPQPLSARYLRLDLDDATLNYLEAGRLAVGAAWQPGRNYAYGAALGWVDPSDKTWSRGRQLYADRKARYRTLSFKLPHVAPGEWTDHLLALERAAGAVDDVLVVLDPAAPVLGAVSIWGPVSDPEPATRGSFIGYEKSMIIEERF